MALLSVVSSCNSSKFYLSTKGNGKEAETRNAAAALELERKQVCIKGTRKSLAFPLMAAALVALSPFSIHAVSLAQTMDVQRGARLFGSACIGCHDTGGNVIQPGATLFRKDLQRNGVETEEEIYKLTYFGKGRMPGFGENCTPRGQCTFGPRLRDEEIKILAEFVKLQADQEWPKIDGIEN
ncbi:hypothetical protein QYF36_014369 [Acer negundo]|nr:hypothetical protein QYF36_014369 [Acer negundo]